MRSFVNVVLQYVPPAKVKPLLIPERELPDITAILATTHQPNRQLLIPFSYGFYHIHHYLYSRLNARLEQGKSYNHPTLPTEKVAFILDDYLQVSDIEDLSSLLSKLDEIIAHNEPYDIEELPWMTTYYKRKKELVPLPSA